MEVIQEELQEENKTAIKINTIIPYFSYRNKQGIIVEYVETTLRL